MGQAGRREQAKFVKVESPEDLGEDLGEYDMRGRAAGSVPVAPRVGAELRARFGAEPVGAMLVSWHALRSPHGFMQQSVVVVQAGGRRLPTGVGEDLFTHDNEPDDDDMANHTYEEGTGGFHYDFGARSARLQRTLPRDDRILYQPTELVQRKKAYYRMSLGLAPRTGRRFPRRASGTSRRS